MANRQPAAEELWPLVGREQELAAVLAAYGRHGAGVVLLGAAGVGKTRLAREAVARLAADGRRTVWATATRSAASVPLGALAHLLVNKDKSEQPLDALAGLVARFTAGAGAPPVLAVDDVHLLDDASATLVHHLATSGRAFVLLTARAGEPAPDAATAVWADGPAERVDVPPLDGEAVLRMLAHALDGPLDPISVGELRHMCAGNPMLLRELIYAGQTSGALRQVGGVWRWRDTGYVTSRLVDVVRTRLGGLEPELREVVEPLACGEPLPVPMLEALAGRPALARAEQRRLVVIENNRDRLLARLAHPLYADVIRASLPRYREVQLCRALTEAIEATPMRRRDDVLYAAQWRLRAGLPARPDLMHLAVQRARERADLRLAEELARAAGRAGGGWQADLALAEVLIATGRYAEAAAALPPVADSPEHDLRVRWRVADHRIRYWGSSDRSTVDVGPADPTAEAARSWLLVLEGCCAEGVEVASAALQAPHLGPDAADWAASAVVAGAGLLGRHDEAMAALRRGLAVAEGNREAHLLGKAQVAASGCLALIAAGRLRAAADLAASGYREAVELAAVIGTQATPMVGVWAATRGIVASYAGRVEVALPALREATVLLDEWPTFRLTRVYLAQRAAAYALAGDLQAAADWLRKVDELGDSPGRLFDAWVERNRAWVAAATGDLTSATRHSLAAAGLAAATGQPTTEAFARYDAVRFGSRDLARLNELAAALGDTLTPTLARAAAALVAADAADALDRVATDFAEAGHLLFAAEAAAEAHHRHARAGRRARAQASLGRAADLIRDCGTARTHRLDLTGAQNSLTARELHVAKLAAAGQSGPSIAAKLGLSVRTVNNHLGRIYSKLGVNGRNELAEMIATRSPDSGTR